MTPEGGFGPYGQPPSLDAIIKKIQQQLQSFNFQGAPILVLLPIALILISLWTAWFTVQPAETGIVQRFGKVVRTAGPGLHFKVPIGDRNGPNASDGKGSQRRIRLPDTGHRLGPADAVCGRQQVF